MALASNDTFAAATAACALVLTSAGNDDDEDGAGSGTSAHEAFRQAPPFSPGHSQPVRLRSMHGNSSTEVNGR